MGGSHRTKVTWVHIDMSVFNFSQAINFVQGNFGRLFSSIIV